MWLAREEFKGVSGEVHMIVCDGFGLHDPNCLWYNHMNVHAGEFFIERMGDHEAQVKRVHAD
jgi:hypothetical protein